MTDLQVEIDSLRAENEELCRQRDGLLTDLGECAAENEKLLADNAALLKAGISTRQAECRFCGYRWSLYGDERPRHALDCIALQDHPGSTLLAQVAQVAKLLADNAAMGDKLLDALVLQDFDYPGDVPEASGYTCQSCGESGKIPTEIDHGDGCILGKDRPGSALLAQVAKLREALTKVAAMAEERGAYDIANVAVDAIEALAQTGKESE